jgi:hypothetical protein
VKECQKYLQILNINFSFDAIEDMSMWSFKKLVKEKTGIAAFKYLIEKKNQPNKQTKIARIVYEKLVMQHYLLNGNKNTRTSKMIFKARTKSLDIKTLKNWKYDDDLCVGCISRKESIEELLSCDALSDANETEKVEYQWLFEESGINFIKKDEKKRKIA